MLRKMCGFFVIALLFSLSGCGPDSGGGGTDNASNTDCPEGVFGCITLSGADTEQIGTIFIPQHLVQADLGHTIWAILGENNKASEALSAGDVITLEASYFGSVEPIGGFESILFLWQVGSDRRVFFCDSRSDQGVPQCGGTLVRDDSAKTVTFNNLELSVASSRDPNNATGTLILNGTMSIDNAKEEALLGF